MRKSTWHRTPLSNPPDEDEKHYWENLAEKRPKYGRDSDDNMSSDIHFKRAALKASPSVVALVAYSGEEEMMQGSGTIIESSDNSSTVLTSANLIRRPTPKNVGQNDLLDHIKIIVHTYGGKSYQAQLWAYDFHFNLAAIKFQPESPVANATLARMDDTNVASSKTSFEIRPHIKSSTLSPGDAVIAIGRYFAKPFDLMIVGGEYWLERPSYDCKELFLVKCRITRSGDGGPLINLAGEVIGITFYDFDLIPCMPMNIAYKWWEHYKKYEKCCRPYVGMQGISLWAVEVTFLEKLIVKFRDVSEGIFVEEVIRDSPAFLAGICLNDVITRCDGKTVNSFYKLFEIIFDKVGDVVDLVVLRTNNLEPLHLKMLVVEATSEQFNSWPSRNYR